MKFPYINSEWRSGFFWEWSHVSDLEDLDRGLINDINSALADPLSEIETGSQLVDVIIYQDKVSFYPDNAELFTMPTIEFKAIVLGWRDFLLSHPLNGTQVL